MNKTTTGTGHTPVLDAALEGRDNAIAELAELKRERADLLAACEALLAACVANHLPGCPELDDAQHEAAQAIAKAKGA